MKKSKIAHYAVVISAVCAAIVLISTIIAVLVKKDSADTPVPYSGDSDYLDDLDAPAIAEKEDRHSSKVRRGYIPIKLGRQDD